MKKYGTGGKKGKLSKGSSSRPSMTTKSWDGKKQTRSTKNKGFGPC